MKLARLRAATALIVALAVIGIEGGRIVLNQSKYLQTRAQIGELQEALRRYYVDNRRYPTTDQGLLGLGHYYDLGSWGADEDPGMVFPRPLAPRSGSGGGIGIDGEMGPGLVDPYGRGYGHGIGEGFGGFIGGLRRKGLDVVLVIDGAGSMKLIIDDVKARMEPLVQAIHRLVPIARIGIVVFGGKGGPMKIQPLTLSPQELATFLNSIQGIGGGEWKPDTFGACQTAINKMDWKPYAKKVIVLVGDSAPPKEDFAPLLTMIRQFKSNNGTFNTVDVAEEEHERFEHRFRRDEEPPKISPLPEFYRQTQAAYGVLATAGGGSMKSLTKDVHVNQLLLILAFGDEWQPQVAQFGRGLSNSPSPGP